jgi:hypothetical protein
MKQQLLVALTRLSFLGVILCIAASAQGQSLSTGIQVDIPFDFIVADKIFAAGEYSFRRMQDDDTVFRISESESRSNSMYLTHSVRSATPKVNATLVFHRYGNQYFLNQIWGPHALSGRQVYKSRKERELERRLARNSSVRKDAKNPGRVETVTLVAELQ